MYRQIDLKDSNTSCILEGTIEDYEEFIEKYSKSLHQNHYHMLTAKHTLLQMYGRSEGCLIQDMPIEKVIFVNKQLIWHKPFKTKLATLILVVFSFS